MLESVLMDHSLDPLLWQMMSNGSGERTKLTIPFMSGHFTPGGQEKRIRCKREVTKRKSSVLARVSPRQTLGPMEKGRKDSGLKKCPLSSKKFSGLKVSGYFQCSLSVKIAVKLVNITVPLGMSYPRSFVG